MEGFLQEFRTAETRPGRKFGLSIFTKGRHGRAAGKYFRGQPNEDEKNQAWGTMTARFGDVQVYNTHIHNARSSRQIPELKAYVDGRRFGKALIAGDFNEEPDTPRMSAFYDSWFECDAKRRPTWQTGKIDYIWATWKPVRMFGGTIRSKLSNHRLVWALIEWN
jgi:endonuclease/exonuclease/phosphatase family metal-dependent hydrolase